MPGNMEKTNLYLFKTFAFSNLGSKRFNIDINIKKFLNNRLFHNSYIQNIDSTYKHIPLKTYANILLKYIINLPYSYF